MTEQNSGSARPGTQAVGGSLRGILARAAVALVLVGVTIAAWAIFQNELTKVQAKIILTTWSGAYFSACALACLSALDRGVGVRSILGLTAAGLGFCWFMTGVWAHTYEQVWFWKGLVVLVAMGFALAHTSRLAAGRLAFRGRTQDPAALPYTVASGVAEVGAWLWTGMLCLMVLTENASPLGWRLFSLGTLLDFSSSVVASVIGLTSRPPSDGA